MKKFNIYYYGEDRSHCGSCWERDNEDVTAIITTLSPDEVKDDFIRYCNVGNFRAEKISYTGFLQKVAEKAHLYDDEKDGPIMDYFCIYFDLSGQNYLPDFNSYYNHMIADEHDISKLLNPEEVLGSGAWKKLQDKMEFNKNNRLSREKEYKEFQKIKDKKITKYISELKEFYEYKSLHEEWQGASEPTKGSGESLKNHIDNLKKYERYMELKDTWWDLGNPTKPDLAPHYPKNNEIFPKIVTCLGQVKSELELEKKIKELGLLPLRKGGAHA